MKYAFLVAIAMFAFVVACGKKDKKQVVGKSASGAQLDCNDEKNKKETKCKDKLEAEKKAREKGSPETSPDRKASGAEKPAPELETIPNVLDKDLSEKQARMSIQLNNQTALIANLLISAQNDNLLPVKVICPETINSLKDIEDANPEELQASAHIMLFNGSSIVADLKVTKGDATNPTKLYMLSCNSKPEMKAEGYKNKNADKSVNYRELSIGQQAYEYITLSGKKDAGVLASFECGDDESVLKSGVKKIGDKAANRIRLRKGSAVMVFRASEQKIKDKKLNELGTEAQKDHTVSVINCSI